MGEVIRKGRPDRARTHLPGADGSWRDPKWATRGAAQGQAAATCARSGQVRCASGKSVVRPPRPALKAGAQTQAFSTPSVERAGLSLCGLPGKTRWYREVRT